ncbi:MAG TPA: hypothetical protein VGT24_12120 [Candidatus Acidoferrales bacterium]|nr:hypothetical protein [Candidatus Acidoferrales bacterium]
MIAAALRAASLSDVDNQAQQALHWPGIIAPDESLAQSFGAA